MKQKSPPEHENLDWLCRPIAHRGLHDSNQGIIENTSSAIEAALNKDYAIELDVRPAAQGLPVIFHDKTLERVTEGSGTLTEQPLSALKKIRYKNSSDRIISLRESLEQIASQVPLLLEIKSEEAERDAFLSEIIKALGSYPGRAAVMSFNPHLIAQIGKNSASIPDVARGLVAKRFHGPKSWPGSSLGQRFFYRHLLTKLIAKAAFIAYDIQGLPALAPLSARHLFGLPLLTWTVKTQEQQKKAQRWSDAMIFEGFCP